MRPEHRGAPAVDGVSGFLDVLRESDDLMEISEPVAPRFEIGAVLGMLGEQAGPAALFTNVAGYPGVRVVGNVLGRRRRLAQALGVGEGELSRVYLERRKDRLRPHVVARRTEGSTTKTGTDVDVFRQLPALTHHEGDSSPYLTCTVAIARDPDTGELNMGLHRVQVRSERTLAIYLQTPPLSGFMERARRQARPLQIALVNGIHPATVIAAVTWCPQGQSKLEMAGGLLGGPLALVECQAVDLQVPLDSQYLIEGVIEPEHRGAEGVFGESSGIYVEGVESPIVQVKSLTWRRDPLYQGLQPWSSEDDALFNLCFGSDLLERLRVDFPFIEDLHVVGGTVCAHVVVRVGQCSPESLRAVMEEALTHNPFVKKIVAVNDDIDIRSAREVEWAVATRFQAGRDLLVLTGIPGSPIDPSTGRGGLTTKIAVDATFRTEQWAAFHRVSIDSGSSRRARSIIDGIVSRSSGEE